jgi:hypothetical protein
MNYFHEVEIMLAIYFFFVNLVTPNDILCFVTMRPEKKKIKTRKIIMLFLCFHSLQLLHRLDKCSFASEFAHHLPISVKQKPKPKN